MFFDGAGIRLQSIRDLSVGLALRQSGDCANEPPAMSETYPLRAKAIGRSWALELVLRITGIGVDLHLNRRHALERNPRFKCSNHCT